jgi:hypothetical protein
MVLAESVHDFFGSFAPAPLSVGLIHGRVETHASNLIGKEIYACSGSQIAKINLSHCFKTDFRRNTHDLLRRSEK